MGNGGMDFSGRALGPFDLMDEIGRGGMATVYRARQRSINRIVAVKVLPPALMHDPAFYERFTREVDIISHLEHPHILPIYDYGEADGTPYIAMRYLAGGSMAQVIRRGLPAFEWLVRPLDQIAQALDYAHQQGVIHRDLKPGNILLDERNNAYLTDFGIARVLDSNLTGSAIIGTPAYMSPEQANALPLDSRSDIYSFGIVLFELLTGREPYESETPVGLLLQHLNDPVPSVRLYRPEAPPALDDVIQKATAKHPANRYPSVSDMADAYAAAVRGYRQSPAPTASASNVAPTPLAAGVRPRLTPAPGVATVTPPASPTRQAPFPEPVTTVDATEPTHRKRAPVVLGVVAMVLAGAVVALLLYSNSAPVPPVYVTPTPQSIAQPTAFPGGTAAVSGAYQLTVPEGWVFADQSDATELVHHWQGDPGAYVALTRGVGDLGAWVEGYEAAHFPASGWARLDEATAPDGTIRRSYRQLATAGQDGGQTDVFFRGAGNAVVALELYAADRWGNTLVPVFQQVLDSLRVTSAG